MPRRPRRRRARRAPRRRRPRTSRRRRRRRRAAPCARRAACRGGRRARLAPCRAGAAPRPPSVAARPCPDQQAAVEQQAHVLLGVERVAADALDDRRRGRPPARRSSRRAETRRLASRRVEAASARCAFDAVARCERRPGARRAARAASSRRRRSGASSACAARCSTKASMPSSGPVQVLEDEDRRARGGDVREEARPGREALLPRGLRRLEAEQRAQALAQPGPVLALGQHGLELGFDASRCRPSRGCRRAP